MASEVLLTISKDEVERARLMSEEKYQLDMQSKLVYAKRQERKEIAKNALAEGASLEFVSKITGIDIETIKALSQEKTD